MRNVTLVATKTSNSRIAEFESFPKVIGEFETLNMALDYMNTQMDDIEYEPCVYEGSSLVGVYSGQTFL